MAVDITPNLIENLELLAIKSDLGGTEYVNVDFDLKDHASGPFDAVSIFINYCPGASPGDGLKVVVYGSSDGGAAKIRYATLFPLDFDHTSQTTVDADSGSGQKVLNVAATTMFAVGDYIIIDPQNTQSKREVGQIDSIQAAVSVTLADNLVYTHLGADAEPVRVWQGNVVNLDVGALTWIRLRLENLDTDAGDDCVVQVYATGRKGYQGS